MKKEEKLFNAITEVEDDLVKEAACSKKKKGLRPWQRWTALAACAAILIAAAALIPGKSAKGGKGQLVDVIYPKAYAFEDHESARAVRDENPVDEDFLSSISTFTYKTASALLSQETENVNYSPLSLYYALALAASGAEGETQAELLDLLDLRDTETLSAQCGNLYRVLYTDNRIGKLHIANSLWLDQDVNFQTAFVENAAENFYASAHSVDFGNPETGAAMAAWVTENSNGLLVPEMETNAQTIFSILNTVYFYDQWIDRFDKNKTEADTFYPEDGSSLTCDFMNSKYGSASFAKGEGFTRSALSLKNAGRMIFILPDEGVTPQELLSDPARMREVFEGGEEGYGEVTWQIPKFSFGAQMELREMLIGLGVEQAFSQSSADFSGLTDGEAWISSVRQETHIAIDEDGVEAAAFTQIDYAGAAPPSGSAEMILNRPFIYGITDKTGNLLFVGICENPAD